jgi:P27 family predicted phage terminase small subunit
MARRGPQPKPTALKLLTGNRGKRRLNCEEPAPPKTLPPRPSWLKGAAAKKYDQLGGELLNLGILTSVDGDLLASYCAVWDRLVWAEKSLAKKDAVTRFKGKTSLWEQVSPAFTIWKELLGQLHRLGRELGLTPASRPGIKASKPAAPSGLGDFARRKGAV